MDSLNSVWQSILAEISKNITSTAYNTWFADCSPVELGETSMVIQTTSDFKRSVIVSRFGEVIRAALREIFSCDMELVVLTTEELEMQKQRRHMTEIPPEMDGYKMCIRDSRRAGRRRRHAGCRAYRWSRTAGRSRPG